MPYAFLMASLEISELMCMDNMNSELTKEAATPLDQAVEELKAELSKAHGLDVLSIKIDWYLWEEGERKDRAGVLPPHHRTLTTFY